MEQELISVIIPIYKMEKFIRKCLDSIISSSYKNLEIICVDDASPDNSMKIVEEFKDKDSRIKIVTNPENQGLFRTRVNGMKVAKGAYVAFVDADDFISVDWFRLLYKKIKEENADMVIGNTINVDENMNFTYYNNYRSLTSSHKTLEGENILQTFLKQEGACFLWHTVWDKLYSKNLIEKCMPYFEKVDFHLIMGEDIAFSSVFFTHAKRLAFANVDAYFYYRHSEASTSTTLPLEKIIKNIKDLKKVFDYFEGCMKQYNKQLYIKNKQKIENFKARYHRIWSGNVWNKNAQKDKETLDAIKNTFGTSELILPYSHDFYFYELTTFWSARLENLKKDILNPYFKVISFDIFDTLIVRPFYEATDIMQFVGKYASKLIPTLNEKQFADFRYMAEQEARRLIKLEKTMVEDVTLTEIYDAFSKLLGVSQTIANEIMNEEIRLEIKFSKARNIGKELFELAIEANKKVVLTSDMYLERSTIEEILKKNSIKGYEKLYLSNTICPSILVLK